MSDYTMEEMKITEKDYEEMCQLAEDVEYCLRTRFNEFDAEGNKIREKYTSNCEDYERDVLPLIQQEMDAQEALPEYDLLSDLYFSPKLGYQEVRTYTRKDIIPLIEPIIPKALCMFRKGTAQSPWSKCAYRAADSVPDEFLIAALAREVRNVMWMNSRLKWKMKHTSRYLVAIVWSSDIQLDDLKGIYYNDENLKNAYEKAVAEVEEDRKRGYGNEDRYAAILEFRDEEFRALYNEDTFRVVKPENLQCFFKK